MGAQRREIAENDLPQVREELGEYLGRLRAGESVSSDGVAEPRVEYTTTLGLVAEKEKIAASGEYNLSGERYRENDRFDSAFPYVPLNTVARIVAGNPAPQGSEYFENGEFPFIRTSDVGAVHRSDNFSGATDKVNQKAIDELRLRLSPPGTILFPKSGASTFLNHRVVISEAAYVSSHLAGIICNEQKALPKYVYHLLCQMDARDITPDQAYPSLRLKEIGGIQIPLPPLEVQGEIVAEIEVYQRVIDGARAVIDNYRPQIVVDPEWPMVAIAELTKPEYGFTEKAEDQGDTRFIRITDISEDGMLRSEEPKFITLTSEAQESVLEKGDILVARTGATYGKTMIFEEDYPAVFASYLIRLRFPLERVHPCYYWAFAQSDAYWNQAKALMTGGGQPQFNGNAIKQIKFPLPSLETQQAIVAEIEAEQSLVAANRELVERMAGKIRAAIGRVWGR